MRFKRALAPDQRPHRLVTPLSMLVPTETIETTRIRRIAGCPGN